MYLVLTPSKKLLVNIRSRNLSKIAKTDLSGLYDIDFACAVSGKNESKTSVLDQSKRPNPAVKASVAAKKVRLLWKNKHTNTIAWPWKFFDTSQN